VGDGHVNTDSGGGRGGWGKEIHRDVQRPTAGKVWDSLGWLQLHIVFGADEVGDWGEELKNGEDCISDMVMEGGFELF
jgi:hypothetical protein